MSGHVSPVSHTTRMTPRPLRLAWTHRPAVFREHLDERPPHLMIAQQRSAELLRAAEKGRLERDAATGPRSRWHPFPHFVAMLAVDSPGAEQSARAERLTLRFGSPADEDTLARLAALDSSKLPAYPVLLAEVDGQLLAALGLSDGTAIADPFHRTAHLIELLRARAHQLDAGQMRRSSRLHSWSRVRALAWR